MDQFGVLAQDDVPPIEQFVHGVHADGQDQIGFLEQLTAASDAQSVVAEELWVCGRKRDLGAPRLVDGESHQFGQFHGQVVGVVFGDPVSHHHERAFGGHDKGHRLLDTLRIRPVGVVDLTGGHDVHLSLAFQGVCGKADVDRALGMAIGFVECTADHRRDLVRKVQFHRPFGNRTDQLRQISLGLVDLACIVVGRHHDHGGPCVQCV